MTVDFNNILATEKLDRSKRCEVADRTVAQIEAELVLLRKKIERAKAAALSDSPMCSEALLSEIYNILAQEEKP